MKNVRHFAVCIRNDEYEASLELRKIYEVLEDSAAAKHDMAGSSTKKERTTSIPLTGS